MKVKQVKSVIGLTHYRRTMPFGNRKKNRGSFQFSIITFFKNITPLET